MSFLCSVFILCLNKSYLYSYSYISNVTLFIRVNGLFKFKKYIISALKTSMSVDVMSTTAVVESNKMNRTTVPQSQHQNIFITSTAEVGLHDLYSIYKF